MDKEARHGRFQKRLQLFTCPLSPSAFLAVLNRDDVHHIEAKATWIRLLEERATLVTTNYVLIETFAILQHRMGIESVRSFNNDIYPILDVEWCDGPLHERGVSSVLSAGRKLLSLVDCISFDVMRHRGLQHAFTFDKQFRQQGFETI